MAGIPSHIEQALRTLEHVDRTMLIECGADKRIRQLWRTTETKKKAKAFDSSFESPKRLAAMYGTARAGALDAGPVSATASRESPPPDPPLLDNPRTCQRQNHGEGPAEVLFRIICVGI